MSDVALAVAANRENTPWIATAIGYGEVRQMFLQAKRLKSGMSSSPPESLIGRW